MIQKEKRLLSEKEITEKFIEYYKTGNKKIREEIIINYIYLVKNIVKKISNQTGFSIEELESYGYEGLIRAVDRYDITKEGSRINYITQAIRKTIFSGFRDLRGFGGKVTTDAYLLERYQVETEYEKTLLEDPNLVEVILDRLIQKGTISKKYRQENKIRILLDITTNIDQYKQSSELIDENSLDYNLIQEESKKELLKILEQLPPTNQEIIKLRYGLYSEKETLTQISNKYKMSPEGVRKIENRSLKALKKEATKNNLGEYLYEFERHYKVKKLKYKR